MFYFYFKFPLWKKVRHHFWDIKHCSNYSWSNQAMTGLTKALFSFNAKYIELMYVLRACAHSWYMLQSDWDEHIDRCHQIIHICSHVSCRSSWVCWGTIGQDGAVQCILQSAATFHDCAGKRWRQTLLSVYHWSNHKFTRTI